MDIELSGPLNSELLIAAFQRVIEENKVFSLLVSDGLNERVFYFALGGIRLIRVGKRKSQRLGDMFIAAGVVSEEDAERIAAAARKKKLHFGQAAAELGLVTSEQAEQALKDQIHNELLELFFWDGAELRLVRGQPPKEVYERRRDSAVLTAPVPETLRRVLSRVQKWSTIVGRMVSGAEVYELTERASEQPASELAARLFHRLDGRRNASQAIAAAETAPVESMDALISALAGGQIRRVPGKASQRLDRDERARRIAELENALEDAVDAVIVRTRLARLCEDVGEKARAAGVWRELGEHHRRLMEDDLALAAFRECVRLLPSDFAARERILDIHRTHGNQEEIVREGRPLVDLLIKNNLLNRARTLLVHLVAIRENDTRLIRQLVTVLIGLGEREEALRYLRKLAGLLEASGVSESELKDVYVRILALNPKDAHAKKRLDSVLGRSKHRMRQRVVFAGVLIVLGVCGAGYAYETSAREAMREAFAQVEVRIQEHDFDGARDVVQDTLEKFPHSPKASEAKALIETINELEKGWLRDTEKVAKQRSGLSAEEDAAARALRKHGDQLVEAGKIREAHAIYREIQERYPNALALVDLRVPLRIEPFPPDARVLLNGELIGQGAQSILYDPTGSSVVRVERAGFAEREIKLSGVSDLVLDVLLEKGRRWSFRSDAAFESPPLLTADTCYVAGRDRRVTAIALADGRLRWRVGLGLYSDLPTRPVLSGDTLIVAASDGGVFALDAKTGKQRWQRDLGFPISVQPLGLPGGQLLLAPADGSLRAISAKDGKDVWERPARTIGSGEPILTDSGTIAFVDLSGALRVIAANDGQKIHESPTASLRGPPAVQTERVWVNSTDQSVWLLAPSGELQHRVSVTGLVTDIPPEVHNASEGAVKYAVAYVVCSDGRILGVRNDGVTVFDRRLDDPISAQPAYADGRLYVPTNSGTLYVLSPTDGGKTIWKQTLGAGITARPHVQDGAVFVVTSGGELVALEL